MSIVGLPPIMGGQSASAPNSVGTERPERVATPPAAETRQGPAETGGKPEVSAPRRVSAMGAGAAAALMRSATLSAGTPEPDIDPMDQLPPDMLAKIFKELSEPVPPGDDAKAEAASADAVAESAATQANANAAEDPDTRGESRLFGALT